MSTDTRYAELHSLSALDDHTPSPPQSMLISATPVLKKERFALENPTSEGRLQISESLYLHFVCMR
jgi:hypothetical protein